MTKEYDKVCTAIPNKTECDIVFPDNYILSNDLYRPVKLIFEGDLLFMDDEGITYSCPSEETVLLELLLELKYNCDDKITTQQYRSEKGKIRKGFLSEVINFIRNRGLYEKFIQEIQAEREEWNVTFTRELGMPLLGNTKFGVVSNIK